MPWGKSIVKRFHFDNIFLLYRNHFVITSDYHFTYGHI